MVVVYILKCRDGSYYTGSTTDLQRRVLEHNNGQIAGYTFTRRPVTVVFCQEVSNLDQAFALERQIKGWSRAKKEALIAGDYSLLHDLSQDRRNSKR